MIYEYYCKKCDEVFERFENRNLQETDCPECSGKAEKIMSRFGFNAKALALERMRGHLKT